MPEQLAAYWMAWNENDLDLIPLHLKGAVADDVEWNDPNDSFVGIEHLVALMRRVRSTKPHWTFEVASKLDYHHHRYRYRPRSHITKPSKGVLLSPQTSSSAISRWLSGMRVTMRVTPIWARPRTR